MELATLVFSTIKEMQAFVDTLGGHYSEINVRTLTVICLCSEHHIITAIEKYGAQLVERG